MSDCATIRPLLFRVPQGEAAPGEAMTVARHLSDCTTCRILLAREGRLDDLLENGLEDLPVDDERFVRNVMNNLPQDPPRPRRKGRGGGLKLACILGFLGLLALQGLSGSPDGMGPTAMALTPVLDLTVGEAGAVSPAGWTSVAGGMLAGILAHGAPELPLLPLLIGLVSLLGLSALVGGVTLTTVVALAARTYL